MTLHADPDAGQIPPFDMPDLIQRPGRRPRVPLWYWFVHPWRAFWIARLIQESWAWRPDKPRSDDLTWCEYKLAMRTKQLQDTAVAKLARQLDRQADHYESMLAEAKRAKARAEETDRRPIKTKLTVKVYAAGPMSVKRAKRTIERCQHRIATDTARGQTRHQENPSRLRTTISYVPLGVDIVALVALIAKSFNVTLTTLGDTEKIPDTASAIGFGLIAAVVLALLSHSAGDAAWHLRSAGPGLVDDTDDDEVDEDSNEDDGNNDKSEPEAGTSTSRSDEFPGAKPLLYAKLSALLVVSLTAGISVGLRVLHPVSGQASSLGSNAPFVATLVGLCVFLGPWIFVVVRMRSGSLEVRTIEELTDAMAAVDDEFSARAAAAVAAQADADKAGQAGVRSAASGLVAAGAAANSTRQVIAFARARHREAGKYAVNADTPDNEPLPLLGEILKMDTTPVEEVRKRFTKR